MDYPNAHGISTEYWPLQDAQTMRAPKTSSTQLELLKWLPTAAQRAIVLTGCLCPITRSGRINPGNGHCRRLTALTLSTQRILPMS